jgi:hypothetical protein
LQSSTPLSHKRTPVAHQFRRCRCRPHPTTAFAYMRYKTNSSSMKMLQLAPAKEITARTSKKEFSSFGCSQMPHCRSPRLISTLQSVQPIQSCASLINQSKQAAELRKHHTHLSKLPPPSSSSALKHFSALGNLSCNLPLMCCFLRSTTQSVPSG